MEPKEKQKLIQTIVNMAWEDESFKKELLDNPLNAIEGLAGEGIKFPKDKTIVVNDQGDESVIYINIPPRVKIEDMELSEEQLDIVAGGGDPLLIDPDGSN